jgi:hypothetical protein
VKVKQADKHLHEWQGSRSNRKSGTYKDEFFDFATQVTTLAETATRIDEIVQNLLAESQEEFLQHHESLRIDDWKADIGW